MTDVAPAHVLPRTRTAPLFDDAMTRESILRARSDAPPAPEPTRGSYAAVPKRASFTDLAACRGLGTDLWFPGKGETWKLQEAKKICRGCPVRNQCLSYAESFVGRDALFGTWGGLSKMARARRRNAA